jgi:hypothetical protein
MVGWADGVGFDSFHFGQFSKEDHFSKTLGEILHLLTASDSCSKMMITPAWMLFRHVDAHLISCF